MPLFEKGQQSFRQRPITSQPGPASPKFKPSPWYAPLFQSSPAQKPIAQKPFPSKPAKANPKTLFEEKKNWTRSEFFRRASKAPLKMYSSYERKKILNESLPSRRFSAYISEGEVKTKLREMRRDEYRAKTGAEKAKLGQMRKYLEKQTGLKGKY